MAFVYLYIIFCIYKRKEERKISPRTGRPTDNPKDKQMLIRFSSDDIEKLEYCSTKIGKSKAEIVRMGITKVYNEIRATDALDK